MNRYLIAFVIIFVAILLQQFADFPLQNGFTSSLSDWMHVPMFVAITAVLLWLQPEAKLWQLAGMVLAIAMLTEVLQYFSDRQPSVEDLGRDALGFAIAVIFLRQPGSRYYLAAVVATAIVTLTIPGTYLAAYAYQAKTFPLLYDPADFRSSVLTIPRSETHLTRQHPWAEYANAQVLHVTWTNERWRGIHFTEPVEDWLAHSMLVIDVYNLEDSAQPLAVGVAHHANGANSRRQLMVLKPGHNEIRLDIADLALLDNGEPASIKRVILQTSTPHLGKQLLLGRVRLE